MKRAISQVIGAASFQLNKTAYYLYNVNTGKYLLYGVLCNQGGKYKLEVWCSVLEVKTHKSTGGVTFFTFYF